MPHWFTTPAPPPCFDFEDPMTGQTFLYTVGYATDGRIPCMAVWEEDSDTHTSIPVAILGHAIELVAKQDKDTLGSESAYA
jgi:hypothetical protein